MSLRWSSYVAPRPIFV